MATRAWGSEPDMSDLEAIFWRTEVDPRLRSSGVVIEVLDRVPDWGRMVTTPRVRVTSGPAQDAAARITADADGFPVWATQRQPWRQAEVKIDGDDDLGSRFLDSMRVV